MHSRQSAQQPQRQQQHNQPQQLQLPQQQQSIIDPLNKLILRDASAPTTHNQTAATTTTTTTTTSASSSSSSSSQMSYPQRRNGARTSSKVTSNQMRLVSAGAERARRPCASVLVACILVAVLACAMLVARGSSASPTQRPFAASTGGESKGIFKRSFAGLGCLGVYDKAKFARLDRVCEECYQLYREPDIHTACRQDCFRNNVFTRCVDALLLTHEQKKFDEMVEELYGK